MLKILVPIKRVPDYEQKVKILADGQDYERGGVKWIVNPFDEIAVEEAIRLKEAGNDLEIVVVCIGPAESTEQIRTALAMGADRGILVKSDNAVDSDLASRVLAKVYEKENPSLVVMGKQSIDTDANQTGQLLASILDLPQATFASKLEVAKDWSSADVTREVDGGLETIQVTLPAVVTTDLRLNEPRYASLPGIVKAKKKPLEELNIEEFTTDTAPKVKLLKLQYPEGRKAGAKVESVAELVSKLKNEAKVI